MSKSYAHIVVTGNLTKDIEIKTSGTGNQFGVVTVAVNLGKDGANTLYVNGLINGKLASAIQQYATKGKQILLDGEPGINVYTNNAGQPAATLQVNNASVVLLGNKSDNGATASAPEAPVQQPYAQPQAPVQQAPVQQPYMQPQAPVQQTPVQQPYAQPAPVPVAPDAPAAPGAFDPSQLDLSMLNL